MVPLDGGAAKTVLMEVSGCVSVTRTPLPHPIKLQLILQNAPFSRQPSLISLVAPNSAIGCPGPSSGSSLTPPSWGVCVWLHQGVRLSWDVGSGSREPCFEGGGGWQLPGKRCLGDQDPFAHSMLPPVSSPALCPRRPCVGDRGHAS